MADGYCQYARRCGTYGYRAADGPNVYGALPAKLKKRWYEIGVYQE